MSKMVAIAAAVVVSALGALLFMLSRDKPQASGTAPRADAGISGGPDSSAGGGEARARSLPDEDGPTGSAGGGAASAGSGPSEADAGNRITRDHRGQGYDGPRSPIIPDSVAAIRRAVMNEIKTCAAPLASRGVKGSIQVTLTATSKAGKLVARDIKVRQTDFEDEAFVSCVTRAYTQMVIDSPTGQGDAEYKLLMPFPVP